VIQDAQAVNQILALNFYQQASYLIDTLKADLCEQGPDGWYRFKEPVSKADEPLPSNNEVKKT